MLMAAKTAQQSKRPRRGRPPKGPHANVISFAASDDIVEQIERFMIAMNKATPGITVSRSDAIRILVARGLKAAELEHPQPELPLKESSTTKT
jgi:hypothetical protein